MKTLVLAGGKGTRLFGDAASMPKALIEVGDKPVLWHIMRMFARAGFADFVICLGHKGELIKEYFARREPWLDADFTIRARPGHPATIETTSSPPELTITFADTGAETASGARILRAAPYLEGDCFLVAYCDGLSDIDFRHLVRFHRSHDRIATLTAVRAPCQFGILRLDETDRVSAFEEKPLLKDWVNGGFYVFDLGVLDYLRDDDMLESDTLPRLVEAGQLAAYRHTGFWACLDTYKDAAYLSELWESGRAPWRTWEP